ncbi:MAG: glycosyltransferase family 2 protein, partial [Atopobiaceae bacterium]|nr:glycosyltransferase family 2 protein [Atopobiaceae bacterium]
MERRVPAVSVVVPVYNQAQYLPDAIRSILAQDHEDFELILVDDGSTDGSGELCDSFADEDERIRVIHQENAGLSTARNTGIDASRGEWVAFIDSDDVMGPSYLRLLHGAAIAHDAAIAVAGMVRFSDDPPAILQASATEIQLISGREACLNMYATWVFVLDASCGKLYRRELFDAIRYPVGKTREDAFVSHELLYPQERIVLCSGCVYGYRKNPESIVATTGNIGFESLDALEARITYYERMGDAELAQDTRELLGTWRVGLWMKAYLAGKTAEVPEQWRMRDEEF